MGFVLKLGLCFRKWASCFKLLQAFDCERSRSFIGVKESARHQPLLVDSICLSPKIGYPTQERGTRIKRACGSPTGGAFFLLENFWRQKSGRPGRPGRAG